MQSRNTGSLTPWQGTRYCLLLLSINTPPRCSSYQLRFILADTDKLHRKILEMSRRIRQLEDALQIAQLSLTHPLLSEELLAIKGGVEIVEDVSEENSNVETLPSIGSLTISERGERFLGRTGSEVCKCCTTEFK